MDVRQAIEKAEKNEGIRKLHGYFLGSCFACIKNTKDEVKDWTLLFYNPEKADAIDCFVNEKFVTVGTHTRPVSGVEKMDVSGMNVTIEDAMEAVQKRFSKPTVNVLITLHAKEKVIWTMNMITADMNATTFDIDAKTGKILREETTSLVRRL